MKKTKLQIIMEAINAGMRFSWNLDGIQVFNPSPDQRTETVKEVYESKIGYVTQEMAKKMITNNELTISFEPTPDGLKIWY